VSVFKDESKLSLDYVPPRLPHRDQELKSLASHFRSVIENPGNVAPKVIITGNIGTGKTVLSKRFGEDFQKYAKKKNLNLKYIYANCRESGSFFNVIKNIIIQNYEPTLPQRGYSSKELLNNFMRILDKKNSYALLVLDELEALVKKEGSDPIFSLTRIHETRPPNAPQRISIIFIFREPERERIFKLLDKSTLSTLGHSIINLEKYTSKQLEEILDYRIQEAFKENAVPMETIKLIADLSAPFGDARFAIELCWIAGKIADSQYEPKVLPEHVRKAQMRAHPSLRIEDLRFLSLHEKLLLLAISRQLRGCEDAYASIGDVEETYRVVSEEFNEKPRAHTQIWKYIQSLSATGLISTKVSGKGYRGKTTLIGLYVSSENLEAELSRMLRMRKK
jgi:cell division control protein 6